MYIDVTKAKFQELIDAVKAKNKESENKLVWCLALIGGVVIVALIAYGVMTMTMMILTMTSITLKTMMTTLKRPKKTLKKKLLLRKKSLRKLLLRKQRKRELRNKYRVPDKGQWSCRIPVFCR